MWAENTLKQTKIDVLAAGQLALLGVCWDQGSSFLRGPAQAPPRIRQALLSGSSTLASEQGVDLEGEARLVDVGDIWPSPGNSRQEITNAAGAVLRCGASLLTLGGDHSISYPLVQAHHQVHTNLTILQFDAHTDLYDELDGDRYSHACPFARIMEDGLASRLVQAGVRALNKHQREQAERFGVEIIAMREWRGILPALTGPVYLSLDLDVLDPAHAPGVSHHEPGGMTSRELLAALQGIQVPIVGADIVELNPARDLNDMTAMVAAKFLKEIVGMMLSIPAAARDQ